MTTTLNILGITVPIYLTIALGYVCTRMAQMSKTLVKSKLNAKPCAPRIQPSVN